MRKASKGAPLIVVVGPTASGKTTASIEIAKQFGGEIICADSRTIYRGMDLGTAKPTIEERAGVKHWAIDLIDPRERFSAADFKAYARDVIGDIRSRGKIPFLVGGTGLYIDSVIFDYQFGKKADIVVREKLNALSVEQLQNYCAENNIILPENSFNKRHLIRTIEQNGQNNQRRNRPIENCIIVGIATDKDSLRSRIEKRAEQMFDSGVVEEAKMLGKKYGWDSEAMTSNIYPVIRQYLSNELSLNEAKHRFATLDWKLAKRQLTWFRRNESIKWLTLKDAKAYLSSVLTEYKTCYDENKKREQDTI